MTNLTEKFDELQAQLSGQHEALLAALTAIGDQLTVIAGSSGDTGYLAQIAENTQTTVTQLTDYVVPGMNDHMTLTDNIWQMFRDEETQRATLAADVTASKVALQSLLALSGGTSDPTADNQLALTRSIYNLLLVLLSGFGTLPLPGASTALGLLTSLKECMCEDDSNPTFECEAPWTNTDVFVGEVEEFGDTFARSIARWTGQLPPGLSFSAPADWQSSEADATLTGDWTEWKVFFESETATSIAAQPDTIEGFPVGTWLDIPLFAGAHVTFFTGAEHQFKVTLCRKTDLGAGTDVDCTSFDVLRAEGSIERVTYTLDTAGQAGSVYFDYEEGDASLLYIARNVTLDQPIVDGIPLKTLSISVRYWEFLPGQGVLAFATDAGSLTTIAKVRVCFPPEGNPDTPA